MALEKLRSALAAKEKAENSTPPIPLARAELIENNKTLELNELNIFKEISMPSTDNFQNHQSLLTYAGKSKKNSRR
jgi:hypothetical protein